MVADIGIVNGRLLNVYSGEMLNHNVAVSQDRITYVGPSRDFIGPTTKVIDAEGDYIAPGFFDAHTHSDLFYNPYTYANYVLTRGTTGFFNDGHDLANAVGVGAFLDMMSDLARSPLSIYTGVPAASPPYPGVEGEDLWSTADLTRALAHENVLAISEVTPYLRLLRGDSALSAKLAAAREAGKLVEGHTTGASAEKLNVLARLGVTSCHESLKAEDVLDRIRLGYAVMLRHGSIRRDLPNLIAAVDKLEAFDTSRLMLISDGIFPDHMLAWGNMDWVVAEAIRLGVAPMKAFQMATINPARYFQLDRRLGAIRPGLLANLQVISELERPTPRLVMAKGRLAAEDGRLLMPELAGPEADPGSRPFTLDPPGPETFRIPVHGEMTAVPAIRILDQTVTDLEMVKVPVEDGAYRPEGDLLAAFLISRDGRKTGRGFVTGYCPGIGGIASTASHDTHGLLVLGQNPDDMALAAADALRAGGGISLAQNGRIRARIPLPLGGICSLAPMAELAGQIREMNTAVQALGSALDYPVWTLVFLSFTSVLRLRMTYEGVYDVKDAKIVFG